MPVKNQKKANTKKPNMSNIMPIGTKVIEHAAKEIENKIRKRARALGQLKYPDGRLQNIWIINDSLEPEHRIPRNIWGEPLQPVNPQPNNQVLLEDGIIRPKISALGQAIERWNGKDKITFIIEGRRVTLDLISRSDYEIFTNISDVKNGFIEYINEERFNFSKSLKELIHRLNENSRERENIKAKNLVNEDELLKKADDKEREIIEEIEELRRYVRTNESLRKKFFLDNEQNEIKDTNVFSGSLIIDGGPGTGKTTVLIHRIRYMIDPRIADEGILKVKLNDYEKTIIYNQQTGWIFFSPSSLLKKYLEQAMVEEGLIANDQTVKTWETQQIKLRNALKFTNTQTKRPFLFLPENGEQFRLSAREIETLTSSFLKYLSSRIFNEIVEIKNLRTKGWQWEKEANSILDVIKGVKDEPTIDRIIILLNELAKKGEAIFKDQKNKYTEISNRIAANIYSRLNQKEKKQINKYLLDNDKKKDSIIDEEIEIIEDENLLGASETDSLRIIRQIIRIHLTPQKLNAQKDIQKLLVFLKPLFVNDLVDQLKTHLTFIQSFTKILSGPDKIIGGSLIPVYKLWRQSEIQGLKGITRATKDRFKETIESEPKNVRLHKDETDLLILFHLKIARRFYAIDLDTFKNSNILFLSVFRNEMKGIVAVDEATDFSILEIACMHHLTLPGRDAITLSGDLMQQMNMKGPEKWEDLNEILPKLKILPLVKSYRQTNILTELASELYFQRYKVYPQYHSYQPKSELDPCPLIYQSVDEEQQIAWICERILELYNRYDGSIPNTAIFVKENEDINRITKLLRDNETLLQIGITAMGCSSEDSIGVAEKIRVFDIQFIKGLEFDAVFFLNIDDYEKDKNAMIDKILYVGISRATFYLAITIRNKLPKILKTVAKFFKNSNWAIK